MSHRGAPACPVPVLLARPGGDSVANPDLLGGGTSGLHPAFPLDDVEELATLVRVPVVADARIESHNAGRCRKRWARRRQQVACTRSTGEVGRIQRLQVTEHLGSRHNVHAPTLTRLPTGMRRPASGKILRRLAAGHRPDDQKWLTAGSHRLRQGAIWRVERQVLLAGEEPHQRPPLVRRLIADRPPKHGVAGLEGIKDGLRRRFSLNLELHLALNLGEIPQMRREGDPDHARVWTSTESTAGRSRTMGFQLSPASADAYTCPPVVPK